MTKYLLLSSTKLYIQFVCSNE